MVEGLTYITSCTRCKRVAEQHSRRHSYTRFPVPVMCTLHVSSLRHDGETCRTRRGVEQWQLVGLITRRSWVRIPPPLPTIEYSWCLERGGPTRSHPEHGSETPQRRRYWGGNPLRKIGQCQVYMRALRLNARGSRRFRPCNTTRSEVRG